MQGRNGLREFKHYLDLLRDREVEPGEGVLLFGISAVLGEALSPWAELTDLYYSTDSLIRIFTMPDGKTYQIEIKQVKEHKNG